MRHLNKKLLQGLGCLTLIFCLFFACSLQVWAADQPLFGAIRWDAWYGAKDELGTTYEAYLNPNVWHCRVPFFGKIISDNQVQLGYSQEIIDAEIAYAKHAGLSYWAFNWYARWQQPDMNEAFDYYMTSTHKHDIKFALILSNTMGLPDTFESKYRFSVNEPLFIQRLADSDYQKVLGNRPLLYIGFLTDTSFIDYWGGIANVKKMIDQFRHDVQNAGLENPYIVYLGSDPGIGADAISAYSVYAPNGGNAPYNTLKQADIAYWNTIRQQGKQVVPILQMGWDERPQLANPPEGYFQKATPAEIASFVQNAIDWMALYPQSTQANTAIIYAWNENVEGGWLVPTYIDGTGRIDAISRILTTPTPTPTFKLGDITGPNGIPDGVVDMLDYNKMVAEFTGHPYTIFDYNVLIGNYGK